VEPAAIATAEAAVFGLASAILTDGVAALHRPRCGPRRARPASTSPTSSIASWPRASRSASPVREGRDANRPRRHGKTQLTWGRPTCSTVIRPRDTSPRNPPRESTPVAAGPAVLERKRLLALLSSIAAVAVVAVGLYFTLGGAGGKAHLDAAYKHLEGRTPGRRHPGVRGGAGGRAAGRRPTRGWRSSALRQNDAPAGPEALRGGGEERFAAGPAGLLVRGDAHRAGRATCPRRRRTTRRWVAVSPASPASRGRSPTRGSDACHRGRPARPGPGGLRQGPGERSRQLGGAEQHGAPCCASRGATPRRPTALEEGGRDQSGRRHGADAPQRTPARRRGNQQGRREGQAGWTRWVDDLAGRFKARRHRPT